MIESEFVESFQNLYQALDRKWKNKIHRLALLQEVKLLVDDYCKALNKEIEKDSR